MNILLKDFILAAGILSSLTSCIRDRGEDFSPDTRTEVMLSLVVRSGSSATDTEVLGPAETTIGDAWIYAFSDNILQNSTHVTGIDAESFTVDNFKVPVTGSLMLYAVVNPPSGHNLAQVNNPAALAELTYGITEFFPGGWAFGSASTFAATAFKVPAFGQTAAPVDIRRDTTIAIAADRALARFDILLQRKAGTPSISIDSMTSISVTGSREYGYVTPWNVADETALKSGNKVAYGPSAAAAVPAEGTTPLRAFSFYMPERDCVTSRPSFSLSDILFGSVRKDYDNIVVGTDELKRIERNKVYRIICTFSEISVSPDITVLVEDWDEKSAEVIFN